MRALFVLLLCFDAICAVMHSWKAFYTGSTGLNEFPEFVAVNLLDDEVMGYFDSRTNSFENKQSWMVETLGQQYAEGQSNILRGHSQSFKAGVGILMERFNQSKGVHIVQRMVGCGWDDETGDVKGHDQYGYDGEDFVAFDQKTKTWIAPTPQAVVTKHKWDTDTALNEYMNNYLTQECIEWVKKYVDYGRSSLQRTVRPSVSLLQKSPSSPVTCHATGFHPDKVVMKWMKDGDELHEDVGFGETLHNHDGTFQKSVDLDVSSVKPEDWGKYKCVFQLSGVEDINTKLDAAVIKTNMEKPSDMTIPIIAAVVVIALIAIAAIGFALYKKKQAKCPPSSENSSELSQKLNPAP